MKRVQLFIDGAYTGAESGATFGLVNPATGEEVARVSEGGAPDVDRAAKAAKRALSGPWGQMSTMARLRLLRAVADRIDERRAEFLALEMRDTGKPVSFAGKVDIPRGAANFRIFADMAAGQHEEAFHQDTPDGRGAVHITSRQPVGVVGVICPWNLPLLLMTWKVGPALAAGNTVVVKPSEDTPSTATLLGEVMNEVGIPPGVYNVVHGFGPGSAGEAIVQHPAVDAITFTGESATGRAIMAACATDLKRVSFELGGKNPALVFADCDLDAAVAGTVRSAFSNCGQICLCTERIYVEKPVFAEFVRRLSLAAKALKPGDPSDPDTQMGPLISAVHRDKVASYLKLAVAEGATVQAGGHLAEVAGFPGGFWVQPTVWTGLDHSARTLREEIFGPVCHVMPFESEEEAIALANDTPYGLCAAVWTGDVARAHRVGGAIDAGMVWVNTWFLRDLRTPFGGMKASGIGREGGHYSTEFYTELKNLCIKL
ncbi:MAG: 2-hydroxymuconic semialdehyde dehydrogenase [Myxococcales bacterium]|nr:2-hydroxymuconic semialdehyde dehydrogenase [Myxococcales bacterium]